MSTAATRQAAPPSPALGFGLGSNDDSTETYPSLEELQRRTHLLEHELRNRSAGAESLSGRIIHAMYLLPFHIQPREEVDWLCDLEDCDVPHSADLSSVRIRRAARDAAANISSSDCDSRAARDEEIEAETAKLRANSFWAAENARNPALAQMRSEHLDATDLNEELARNQERSRDNQGRRAWMESAVSDTETETDRFSPRGSRRPTAECTDKPAEQGQELNTWHLTMRQGHAAMMSGIHSLSERFAQTIVAYPGHVTFAAHARGDERTHSSQATPMERKAIEAALGKLDDPREWAAHIGDQTAHGIRQVPVWLDYNNARGHYDGYCKSTIWPLFHYLLWRDDARDRTVWDEFSWDAYVAVNSAFADRIAAEYKPGDIVWVHDYHLMLVPHMLRERNPHAHVALYMHAAFPSSEFFRCLPQRKEIIEGMLGADLVCFQNRAYSRHFISSCVRICGVEVFGSSVETQNGRVTHISHNPIGIDVERVKQNCSVPGVAPKIKLLRELYRDKHIIVGCDKLDVVRGVVQKLQAFYEFLAQYPQWRERVVLIQVTVPALNSSPKLERQVSELVNEINGTFGSLSFTPVQHYHHVIERDEYYALLSVADMFLVTSVRDGMNTTSMEYIVCQQLHNRHPIVLSEFTGTSWRLPDAIQINPWDIGGVASVIERTLRLSKSEREHYHALCHRQIVSHTSQAWALTLALQMLLRLRLRYSADTTPFLDMKLMQSKVTPAKRRLLLLDYDGTLTPIVNDPEAAVPSKRLIEVMTALAADERNIIYIISGRDERFLSKYFSHIEAIGLSAEHGSYFKEHGRNKEWQNLASELDMSWQSDVLNVFRYYTNMTVGSNIEQKKTSIVWHYRNSDPYFGSFQAKECQAHLEGIVTQSGLPVEVVVGKKNVEVRPLAINKGSIVNRILYANPECEFVFCAGDDRTDEDMFRFLASLAPPSEPQSAATTDADGIVIHSPAPLKRTASAGTSRRLRLHRDQIFTSTVGPSSKKTVAMWHLSNVDEVIDALAAIAEA
ncbi:hypothetical protein MCUN1_002699 [Malassezia cuniculi]|uniref:Trehalose-phosphatase n=1 Tax=Malassezia cuniculi TaxID=948313 RepID=A0AAF0EWY3_9BASI|nr:hypothetical protein MCUN1_002699 [Malassezia cuniculi]